MRAHVVQPGEHMRGLCARIGADPDEVWNADENSELRQRRDDPNVLAPGDVIYLPEPVEQPLPLQLYTSNSYTAHVPTIPVHLRLRQGGEPVADEPFEVEGTTPLIDGTTDGDSILEFELPATRREAVVHMTSTWIRRSRAR